MCDPEKGLDKPFGPEERSSSDAEGSTPQSLQDSESQGANETTNGDATVLHGPQSIIVDWDGPLDPHFPQNWPLRKKWTVTMVMVRSVSGDAEHNQVH